MLQLLTLLYYFSLQQQMPQENSGSSTSSGGSGGKATTPTPAPATPMHSMMNEMARTLARRRAQVDRSEVSNIPDKQIHNMDRIQNLTEGVSRTLSSDTHSYSGGSQQDEETLIRLVSMSRLDGKKILLLFPSIHSCPKKFSTLIYTFLTWPYILLPRIPLRDLISTVLTVKYQLKLGLI